MAASQPTPTPGSRLLDELMHFAPNEGLNETPWPGLVVFRADDPAARIPVVYEPCVCVVGHGRKRVHLGDEYFNYDPLHYLVVGVPVPVEAEIVEASTEQPFLSLRLDIDVTVLSELMIDADTQPAHEGAARAIYASRMNQDLSGAVLRLLNALHDAADARVLAPLAVRELLYHILRGEQGHRLRAVALRDSRAHRISAVLRFMREHYARAIDVDELAEHASMSASTFHHNFKSMTSLSPLQYLKSIRLHHARQLMLNDGLSAGDAGHAVGYSSPSQFSREFKRLFGTPPLRERKRLQSAPEGSAQESAGR